MLHFARVPKVSVTIITQNEAAHIAAALASVVVGRRDHRRRLAAAPTTRSRSRGATPDRVIVRHWPGYVAQKNHAAATGEPRLDPVARRRRARDAGARRRDPRAARRRAGRASGSGSRASPVTSAAGFDRRTGIRTVSCDCTTDARRMDGPQRARVGARRRRGRTACAASCGTTPTATSPIISRRSIATRRSRRRQMREAGRTRRTARTSSAIRRWRSCATTCCAAASATARAGFDHLADERVLRAPEVREALGAARRRPHNGRTLIGASQLVDTRHDVLPAHRHGPHLARRPEPGAADGAWACARSGIVRCSWRIPRRAAAARGRRARCRPARATDRGRSARGVAAWRACSASCAPDRPRARPARRGDGGAGAAFVGTGDPRRRSSRRAASISG